MVAKNIVLIFVVSTWASDTSAKELYTVFPIGAICKILDPTIVANFTCRSKSINRTTLLLSRETIYQPGVMLTDVHIKVQAYKKFAAVYRPFLVTLDQDWCAIVGGENKVLFDVINIESKRKFGNAYDPCPIWGRRYEETHAMEYEQLPDILPDGDYRLEIIMYAVINGTKKDFLRFLALGTIRPKTAEQW